jgi:hypothetical protein
MSGYADRFGLEVLTEDECLRLLGTTTVGRLGVVEGGAVLIFPVNFAVADRAILVRTAPGAKLEAARRSPVTLEADHVDDTTRTGWSVMVRGRAEEITEFDAPAVQALRDLPLHPWAGDKPIWLRILPSVISGRRLFGPEMPAPADFVHGEVSEPVVPARTPPAVRIQRVDDQRGRLHNRRCATFEAVDDEGDRVAVASYDGHLSSPGAELTVALAPCSGRDGVEAGAALVRHLAEWAVVDGVRDLVMTFDSRQARAAEVLDASGLPWSHVERQGTVRAELALGAGLPVG